MMDQIGKLLEPMRRRVMNLVTRGVVQTVTEGRIQKLQVTLLADEVLDQVDRVAQYGFTSSPPAGSECVVLFMGGNRDHGVVVATDDRRTRPKTLSAGDSALWTQAGVLLKLQDSTKNVELTGLNKLKVQNGTAELIATLSELLAFLINARTNTMMGPEPLFDVTGADTLTAIKAKIDSFKE